MFRSLFQGKKKTSAYGCSLNTQKKIAMHYYP